MPDDTVILAETPTVNDIDAARARLDGVAVRTPLLESTLLNDRLGRRVLIKAECLQRGGAFKFRGAYNTLASLPDDVRARGVVAFSSGNHAQGVALAARLFDVPAVIIMPSNAPQMKIENTRAYGAEVRLYDRETEDREAIGRALAQDRGLTLVKPYDQLTVIAGQGTIGAEIAEQARDAGADPAAVYMPCGGGGLSSGIATALSRDMADAKVVAVEPAAFDDTARSMAAGCIESVLPGSKSICDALLSPTPGHVTFDVFNRLGVQVTTVSDDDALTAMHTAFETLKVVAEPGGAVALAAILCGHAETIGVRADAPLVAVISGGNVDAAMFARAMA